MLSLSPYNCVLVKKGSREASNRLGDCWPRCVCCDLRVERVMGFCVLWRYVITPVWGWRLPRRYQLCTWQNEGRYSVSLMWLRIGTGGGLSWKRQWSFGLHQILWISGLSDEVLLASQEGLLHAVGQWLPAHPAAINIQWLSRHSALMAASLYKCHQIMCPAVQQVTLSLQGACRQQQRSPAQSRAAYRQCSPHPDGSVSTWWITIWIQTQERDLQT